MRGKLGELARIVAHEILGDGIGEQRGDEVLRDIGVVAAQELAGGRDQRRFGALFIGAGRIGGWHGIPSARPVPFGRRFRARISSPEIFAGQSLEAQVSGLKSQGASWG